MKVQFTTETMRQNGLPNVREEGAQASHATNTNRHDVDVNADRGAEEQSGASRPFALQPDAVAHHTAHALAPLIRHALGHRYRGYAAGLSGWDGYVK